MLTVSLTFNELDQETQERVIEQFQQDFGQDQDWWEFVYEDAQRMFELLGFETDAGRMHFTGFWSQGDGACFTGAWAACRVRFDALKQEAPEDKELHEIGEELMQIAAKYMDANLQPSAWATLQRNYQSRGCHESSVAIELYADDLDTDPDEQDAKDFTDTCRRLMRWFYRQLEQEYEYQTSKEVIRERIEDNEYRFSEDGELV